MTNETLRRLAAEYSINTVMVTGKKSLDRYKFPQNTWTLDSDNALRFNEIYAECRDSLNEMVTTASGSISVASNNLIGNYYSYSIWQTGAGTSLLVVAGDFGFQLTIGAKAKKDTITGNKAYAIFRKVCAKHGINLDSYKVSKEEGLAAKEEIKKPLISFDPSIWGKSLSNCHHIDYHSSYASGLVNTHPEFYAPIKEMYDERKTKTVYKQVLTNTIGYMQSKWIGYSLAPLTRDAMNDNYQRIVSLSKRLRDSGRRVIGYNTDGIWYQGEVFHDVDEGTDIGTWANDKHAALFRAWSDGAYEFLDNDFKCHVVLRGLCQYDKIEPDREKWQWGDMRNKGGKAIVFAWDDNKGFVEENMQL